MRRLPLIRAGVAWLFAGAAAFLGPLACGAGGSVDQSYPGTADASAGSDANESGSPDGGISTDVDAAAVVPGPDPRGSTLPWFLGQQEIDSAFFFPTTVVTDSNVDWVLWDRSTGRPIASGPGIAKAGLHVFAVAVRASLDPSASSDRVEARDATTGALVGTMAPDTSLGASPLSNFGVADDDSYVWGLWEGSLTPVLGFLRGGTPSFQVLPAGPPYFDTVDFATSVAVGGPAGYFAFADGQVHTRDGNVTVDAGGSDGGQTLVLNEYVDVGFLDGSAYCATVYEQSTDGTTTVVDGTSAYASDGTLLGAWPGVEQCGGGIGHYVFLYVANNQVAAYDLRDPSAPPVVTFPSFATSESSSWIWTGSGDYVLAGDPTHGVVIHLASPTGDVVPYDYRDATGFAAKTVRGISADGVLMIASYDALLDDTAIPPVHYATHGEVIAHDFSNPALAKIAILSTASGQTMIWDYGQTPPSLVHEVDAFGNTVSLGADGTWFALGTGYPNYDWVDTWSVADEARLAHFTPTTEEGTIECFGIASGARVVGLGAGTATRTVSADGATTLGHYAMNDCGPRGTTTPSGVSLSPGGTAIASWSGAPPVLGSLPIANQSALAVGSGTSARALSGLGFQQWIDDQHFAAYTWEQESSAYGGWGTFVTRSFALDGTQGGYATLPPPPSQPVIVVTKGGYLDLALPL